MSNLSYNTTKEKKKSPDIKDEYNIDKFANTDQDYPGEYDMDGFPKSVTGKLSKPSKYLLIFFWIGFGLTFGWWIIQRVIIPLFYSKEGYINWDSIAPLFKAYSWPADLSMVFVFAIIYMITKDKDAKKLMFILTGFLTFLVIFGWIVGG